MLRMIAAQKYSSPSLDVIEIVSEGTILTHSSLSIGVSGWEDGDDFEGSAINLTVLDAKYVTSRAVDENWKTILYPGDSTQYDMDEDCNWALSQGDDIWWVWLDEDGKVIPPGVDELLSPKLKGSEILWRPNTKGHNRSIIGVFDEEYDLLAVYYLEITEENAEYYAEVVKITNEFPPR